MLDVDALFADTDAPESMPTSSKSYTLDMPFNVNPESVPKCPGKNASHTHTWDTSTEQNIIETNSLQEVSRVCGSVPAFFAIEREKKQRDIPEKGTAGALKALHSERFRAQESTPDEPWKPGETERNQAGYIVCFVFPQEIDTDSDRLEAYQWALAKRGAFDWLKWRHGDPLIFRRDDNRRPCVCCGNRSTGAGRCSAVDRGEIVARRPYFPPAFWLQRCIAFLPMAGDPDQRPGKVRWPGLARLTEEAYKDKS